MTDAPTARNLPRLSLFTVEGEGHGLACRLTLSTGATVAHFLPPSASPCLCPLPEGGAAFVPDLFDADGPAYFVPAPMLEGVRPLFAFHGFAQVEA